MPPSQNKALQKQYAPSLQKNAKRPPIFLTIFFVCVYKHSSLGLSAERAGVVEGRQLAKILLLTEPPDEFFDVLAGIGGAA